MKEVEEAEIPSHKSMKMFFLHNPAYKHHLKKNIKVKMQHLVKEDNSATYVTLLPGRRLAWNGSRRGRLSPLWCQHLFARPRGADPTFIGRQLVCFEMIGFNLLSFEATYL